MKFVALGATDRIGASCHFLHIDGTGLVLDAGADPQDDGPEGVPRFDVIRDMADAYVDHALVTHAHHDHVGTLPVLVRRFPHVLAHMTEATQRLTDFALAASARLQRRRLEEGSSTHDPLFDEEELDLYTHLYLTHALEESFDVTGPRGETLVKAQFFDAGHLLGSAGILVTFRENGDERSETSTPGVRRVFYTGDTRTERQTILPGGSYPEPPLDALILETTQGADPAPEETARAEEEEKLGHALAEVLAQGGTALLPVFAMGRAQEVLALLDRYRGEGVISPDVPIYTAGSMRAVADLYDRTRHATPRRDPDFKVYGVDQRRLPYSDEATDAALEGPSIHVVASGMMFGPTLSNRLARRLVEGEKNGIFFVGYAKEDTPAERLQRAAAEGSSTEVVLAEERGPQPVRCRVERFRLSSHSHRRELVDLVGRLRPEKVLLVHGETEARAWMAAQIEAQHPEAEVICPRHAEPVEV